MQYPCDREQEILNLLQEECAEIIAIVSKIRRFGYDCNRECGDTNVVQLLKELQDVEILTKEIRAQLKRGIVRGLKGYDAEQYRNDKITSLTEFTGIYKYNKPAE